MPVLLHMFLVDGITGEGRVIGLCAQGKQRFTGNIHLACDGDRLFAARALNVESALPCERGDRLPAGCHTLLRAAVFS